MHKKYSALPTLFLLAAVGCSAADSGSAPENGHAADQADATSAEALTTVQVGEQQITFYVDAEGGILIGSSKPNVVAEFAIVQLERTAGTELTPLELFSALAPGETAPERLVEDHASRVAGLGRSDGAMLQVALEPQRLLEKAWTPAQCDTALGLTAIPVIRHNNRVAIDMCTSTTAGYPSGSCDVYVKTGRHRAGVCNNSPTLAMNTTAHSRHDTSSWSTASATVAPNGSYLWTVRPSLNKDLTGWQPSKVRLQAWASDGNLFHARLAPH